MYIGARSSTRYEEGVAAIAKDIPNSKGTLKPFIADLADLSTIKPAVEYFLFQEHRLDVLFLNAGVMTPPEGSKSTQGYDIEIGTNCLASFLLVSLLEPTMHNVASHFCHPNQSIRVVWVSSLLNMSTPHGGVQLDENGAPKQLKAMENYMQSKAGAYLLSREFSAHQKPFKSTISNPNTALPVPNESSHGNPYGVLHVSLNPGFMKTELQRNAPAPMRAVMGAVFKGPKFGAYTELYAGLAPDVRDGDFVIPWGRKGDLPCHIKDSTKVGEGVESKSVSERFYDWCEVQVKPFM